MDRTKLEELVGRLPPANYDPFDAYRLWDSSKKGRKLRHHDWPHIPHMKNSLVRVFLTVEIIYLLRRASDLVMEWYTTEWPLIPARLAKKLEATGEHWKLMDWEFEIRRAMFAAYYYLWEQHKSEGFTQEDASKHMPVTPTFEGEEYTDDDHQQLQQYALQTATKYLNLVPHTDPALQRGLLDEELYDFEYWRYVTYNEFSRKPEPALAC